MIRVQRSEPRLSGWSQGAAVAVRAATGPGRALAALILIAVSTVACEAHWSTASTVTPVTPSSAARADGGARTAVPVRLVEERRVLEGALAEVSKALRANPGDRELLDRRLDVMLALLELDGLMEASSAEPDRLGWLEATVPPRASSTVALGDAVEPWRRTLTRIRMARRELDRPRRDAEADGDAFATSTGEPWQPNVDGSEDESVEERSAARDHRKETASAKPPPLPASGRPTCPPGLPRCANDGGSDLEESIGLTSVTNRKGALIQDVALSTAQLGDLERQVRLAAACLSPSASIGRVAVRATLQSGRLVRPEVRGDRELPLFVEACVLEAMRRVRVASAVDVPARTVEVTLPAR
jgi:hypothetical protein